MNLAATLELYGVQTGGESARSTLPEDGTNHPESNFDENTALKRKQQVGGVVAETGKFYNIKLGPGGYAEDVDPRVKRATPMNKGLRVRDGKLKEDKGSEFGVKRGSLQSDAAGTAGTLPDLYHVVDPRGRILHKDLGYDDAKKASEARRYAKVVPARRGENWQSRRIEEDKGKRKISDVERRSMPTPDTDWAIVR